MKGPELPSFLSGRTRAGLAVLSSDTERPSDSQARARRRNIQPDEEPRAYRPTIKERQALYRRTRKR
jgi:hypothetical protein